MSIYKGTTPLAGIVTPHLDTRNIGQIIKSYLPLTDAGLHLLDGALLSGDGAYAAFVTYIGQLVSSHPELFTTEADWQACVAAYGVCGKFVYTAAAGADPATVRLPKKASAKRYLIKSTTNGTEWCDIYSDGWCEQGGFIAGSSAYRENIVFTKAFADTNYTAYFGAQYTSTANNEPLVETSTKATTGFTLIKTNTSTFDVYWEVKGYADVSDYESESLYQYIVIANSTKTAIEVDIDEIATDLNGKAGTDLANITASGKSKILSIATGYPDLSSGVAITSGHETTANGWIYINRNFGAASNQADISPRLYFDNVQVGAFGASARDGRDGYFVAAWLTPVKTGVTVTAVNFNDLIFYPNL